MCYPIRTLRNAFSLLQDCQISDQPMKSKQMCYPIRTLRNAFQLLQGCSRSSWRQWADLQRFTFRGHLGRRVRVNVCLISLQCRKDSQYCSSSINRTSRTFQHFILHTIYIILPSKILAKESEAHWAAYSNKNNGFTSFRIKKG